MSAQPQPRLTPEEYLELDRASPYRNEYFDGRMYAMAGGTHRQSVVISNLARELGNALKKRPCLISVADARVRTSGRLYTYSDVAVVCGPPKFADDRKDTLLNPVLVIEVLSPSTEAHDRGLKFGQYRQLESLVEYALVSQEEPRVEIFRRQPSGDWLLSESTGLDASCRFASVDCSIALAEIYDKVTFDEGPTAPASHPPAEPYGRS
jgi:Uma2 family endonuclease